MDLLNRADIVALLFIIYFTCVGWAQGILRFILGFIALLVSGYFAFSNFSDNQDIMGSLKLFIALAIILSIILWAGLNFWNRRISKSKKSNFLSHLLGASIGFFWSLSLSISIIIALVILPASNPFWKNIKKTSRESYLYALVESRYLSVHPAYQMIKDFYEIQPSSAEMTALNTQQITDLRATPEYQAIYEDFRFQEILKDEKIKKYVEEKNVAGLIASKKIQNLLEDKAFIKKFQDLYSRILKEGK
jgi:magnesium-transporting ATPase (P-type)